MISILIVEDEAEKRRLLSQACLEVEGITTDHLEFAGDVISAKRMLKEKIYDLLLLDINLPKRPERKETKDGGLEILRWLTGVGKSAMPQHVVALSAYSEALAAAKPIFTKSAWELIPYSYDADDWRAKVKSTITHLIETLCPPYRNDGKTYRYDFGIVVAVDIELKSILNLPGKWIVEKPRFDESVYYKGTFKNDEKEVSVVVAVPANKGLPHAAVAATKLIDTFRPKFLGMTGICAGLKGRCKIGDVIFADPSWDWGSGKIKLKAGKEYFHVAPYQLRLEDKLRNAAKRVEADKTWLSEIKEKYYDKKPSHEIRIRVGAVASGASVLQSSKAMERVLDQHKDLRALDMEIFAIFAAAECSSDPKPIPFALKSVCDFGNERKNDKHQAYSAYVSAQVLKRFALEIS